MVIVTASEGHDTLPHTIIPQISDAPPPFDKPTADIILRSHDLVNFRVRKCILAEASAFFGNTFDLPQATSSDVHNHDCEHKAGPTVVEVEEDSGTLEKLLRICYPVCNPVIKDIDELRPFLEAAVKYAVDAAVEFAKDRLQGFAESMPIRVYAIALQYKFEKEARIAAKCFLNYSPHDVYVPELEEITGGAYHRILRYRSRCSAAASGVARAFQWVDPGDGWLWFQCTAYNCAAGAYQVRLRDGALHTAKSYWLQHMQCCATLLERRPSGQAVTEPVWSDQALIEARSMQVISSLAHEKFQ